MLRDIEAARERSGRKLGGPQEETTAQRGAPCQWSEAPKAPSGLDMGLAGSRLPCRDDRQAHKRLVSCGLCGREVCDCYLRDM